MDEDRLNQDFLVAMTELVKAMRDLLYRMEAEEVFLSDYRAVLLRLESKIDTISKQTIKIEEVKDEISGQIRSMA